MREVVLRAAGLRADVERDELERDADEDDFLRDVDVDELERAVRADDEPAEAFVLLKAERSLSKSLSACLLVFAALRRNAVSPAVTSL